MLSVLGRVAQLAQSPTTVTPDQVHVVPSAEGMPGAEMIQTLLNWAQMVALWGSLGALFAGAAMYGLAREGGNYGAASRGKTMALGGAVGAVLAGLAPTIVNMLFQAAQ